VKDSAVQAMTLGMALENHYKIIDMNFPQHEKPPSSQLIFLQFPVGHYNLQRQCVDMLRVLFPAASTFKSGVPPLNSGSPRSADSFLAFLSVSPKF
jgi:hypothetical protein